MYAIERIVRKFQQTGSVGYLETLMYARPVSFAKNIAVFRDSVSDEPSTSTRCSAQLLNTSRKSLMRIFNKDVNLHAYKVKLSQELKLTDHFKRPQ